MFKLAELFVDITGNQKPLNRTLEAVHRMIGMAGTAMAGTFAAASAAAGAAMMAGLNMGIREAIEFQDIISRTKVIFGDASTLIVAQAEEMASKFGVVKGEFIDAAASFGAMFKGAGASMEDAALLGNKLAKLGLDMRSFKGGATSTAETLDALAAAMRGEFDPIERFTVFLNADRVAAQALAMGLAKSKTEVSDYAKKMATLQLILEGTKDQQGDMARTIQDTGPQIEMLTGNVRNLAQTIGEALLPKVNEWATKLNDWLKPAMETAGFWSRRVGDAFQIMQLLVGASIENSISAIGAFGENLARIGGWIANNWRALIIDAVHAIGSAFSNLADNLGGLAEAFINFLSDPTQGFSFEWTPLLDGFKATVDKLPDLVRPKLVNVAGEIGQIIAGAAMDEIGIAQDRANALKKLQNAQNPNVKAGEGGDKSKREIIAADKLARDLIEGNTQKQQLDVNKRQLNVMEQTLAALSKAEQHLRKRDVAIAAP